IGVIGHAVAFVGGPTHLADAAFGIPAPPDIARHVGEQKVLPGRVPDRPLGEDESAGDGPDRLVLVHQTLEFRRHHAVGHHFAPPWLRLSPSTLTGCSAGGYALIGNVAGKPAADLHALDLAGRATPEGQ